MVQGNDKQAGGKPDAWLLLVYRVPSEPARKRVAVWRDLKRLGGLYLQQCVCILPKRPELSEDVEQIGEKITGFDGEFSLFEVPRLRAADEAKIVDAFRRLRDKEYQEIVEECETKFVREVEFEHFRQNYTFGEAEEISQDLEKIRRWFERVVERDWFSAPGRTEVEGWIARCEELLTGFEHEVYLRNSDDSLDEEVPLRLTEVIWKPEVGKEESAGSGSGEDDTERETEVGS